jgi:superfamily II DNA or RNA helicase
MLILHGAIKQGNFLLWAESRDPSEFGRSEAHEPIAVTVTEEELPDAGTIRRQPEALSFAASSGKIQQALTQAQLPLSINADQHSTAVICLLESDGIPLASSSMIGRSLDDAPADSLQLAPWIVPTIQLDIDQAVDLLCYCLDEEHLAPGLLAGHDLRFWALSMRFAGQLVARHRFLPGLRLSHTGAFACWEPVFLGEDGEQLSDLALGMPGSCVAGEVDAFDDSYGKHSFEILSRFIGQVADHLVRSSLKGKMPPHTEPLFENVGYETARSIHQRWLEALVGVNPQLEGSPEEFAKLSAQIAEWHRPIAVASDAPYRLCLRLEEPLLKRVSEDSPASEDLQLDLESDDPQLDFEPVHLYDARFEPDDVRLDFEPDDGDTGGSASVRWGSWYVRFLMQSLREPGVLVPVETVLSPEFEDLPLLRGGRVSAREYLFRALGQAVRLCPSIENSFADAVPQGFWLDTAAAHQFLSQAAPALKNAGFSVQLPSWWTCKQKIKAKAKVFSAMNAGTLFSLKDLAQFDWQLALGGVPLAIEELEKLAKLKVPLVRWQGMWLEIDPEQIASVLHFFQAGDQRQNATHNDLIKMALGGASLPEGVDFDGITGEGRIVDVINQLQGQSGFEEISPHARFQGKLRPYQVRGMSWLSFLRGLGFGACLADDMGLGKTIQTLAFVQKHFYEHSKMGKAHKRPSLLVCPTSVIGNWQREAAKFTPDLDVLVHHGNDRLRAGEFRQHARQSALVVTSYTLLYKDYDDLSSLSWDLVILDEAQNVKNADTQQAIAASSLRSQFRIALTGTPVENSVGDLWSLMNFLNPGLLGNRNAFKERFFKPIQVFQDQEKVEQLKCLTNPFILRRLKTDRSIVPDLPEKFERKTRCHLTKEQASLYAAVVGEATESLDAASGMKRKSLVLTTMLRLKQICDHPALVLKDTTRRTGRSGKLKRLTEMLQAVLSNGERALIFTQFASMGEIIQNHLQSITGKEVLFLHGSTSREERERMVERFQSSPDGPPFFVLSLKAGGTGLNLTRANHVFHFDRWWNPAVENQATDRAFRIGQSNDVQVHKFICAGTLEENIDEIIERKKIIAGSTVGSGEGWLTELSTRELRNIFALRETTLVE